jgi:hypothetical protein
VYQLIVQGELEHRRVKKFYAWTNKNDYARQIAQLERRQRLLRGISQRLQQSMVAKQPQSESGEVPERLFKTSPTAHHHISEHRGNRINLRKWVADNHGDPAMKESQLVSFNIRTYISYLEFRISTQEPPPWTTSRAAL